VTSTAFAAFGPVHELAEGPRWDDVAQRATWVDIARGEVWQGIIEDDRVSGACRLLIPPTVGAAVPVAGGGILVAAHDRLVVLTPDGAQWTTAALIDTAVQERFNDAAVDPAGRLLAGTKPRDLDAGHAVVLRIDADGAPSVLRDGLNLANGIDWSPDGTILYLADSLPGTLWAASYDIGDGTARGWRPLVSGFDGLPDGIAVDTEGRIWVAVWNGGQVACFAPTGELLRTVPVAAPHVTAVAFVGAKRDRLLVTTARDELDEQRCSAWPDSGRLHLLDVAATGQPTRYWAGSTTGAGWAPTTDCIVQADPHTLRTTEIP
jgi:sugar lactone lactonase YvrE